MKNVLLIAISVLLSSNCVFADSYQKELYYKNLNDWFSNQRAEAAYRHEAFCRSESNSSLDHIIARKLIKFVDNDCKPFSLPPVFTQQVPSGSLLVDAWIGGYKRKGLVEITASYNVHDNCGRFLGSEVRTSTEEDVLDFNIINPNLDAKESFVAHAPLLDEEAAVAAPEALSRCQNFQPGPITLRTELGRSVEHIKK